MMFGVESKWIDNLCPVAFSNSGLSWLSGAVIEPPAITFSSAACAMTGTPRTHATIVAASPFIAKLPSVGYQHLGDEFRFAHGLAGEWRALLEPRARRGRPPQRLAARIAQGPAQRLVVVIPGKIVTGVELEAVAVGIAHVKEEGVGNTVAARATRDVLEVTAG